MELELDVRFREFTPDDRMTWLRQNAYLEHYARTRTVTTSARKAGVSVSAAKAWKRNDTLGFTLRLEISELEFSDRLQELALERASDPKAPCDAANRAATRVHPGEVLQKRPQVRHIQVRRDPPPPPRGRPARKSRWLPRPPRHGPAKRRAVRRRSRPHQRRVFPFQSLPHRGRDFPIRSLPRRTKALPLRSRPRWERDFPIRSLPRRGRDTERGFLPRIPIRRRRGSHSRQTFAHTSYRRRNVTPYSYTGPVSRNGPHERTESLPGYFVVTRHA